MTNLETERKKEKISYRDISIGTVAGSQFVLSENVRESKDFKIGDRNIQTTWYMPFDNLTNLQGFAYLDVIVSEEEPDNVTVTAEVTTGSFMKIRVFSTSID